MKSLCLLLSTMLLVCCLPVSVNAINLSAQYACVMDAQTGRVLYEKNAYEPHSMASTTKIMTALLALENTSQNETVTVSSHAAGTEGSSIYLKTGEVLPMEDLLYGLMLESGNDAAIAIAEHVGGSVEHFADMMTKRAHEIGAKNTQFKNPNGLDEDGHFTTAYDLALITRTALLNPRFVEIVSTKQKSVPVSETSIARSFYNHNKLLSLYPGCIGVKTGFTKKTGRCLVSAARRDHVTAICVTLNAPNDWNDHKVMLDYAFSCIEARPLVLHDMVLKTIPIKNANIKAMDLLATEDFYFPFTEEEGLSKIKLDYLIPTPPALPITAGTPMGRLRIFYDEQLIEEMDLVAGIDAVYTPTPKLNIWENFCKIWLKFQER